MLPPRTVFLIRSDSPNWAGLQRALTALPHVAIVGDTMSADEARVRAPTLRPNVVLCAARVEGASAVPLLAELRAALPEATLVVFAGRSRPEDLAALGRLPVAGYVLWADVDDPAFLYALIAVLGGAFFVGSREPTVALMAARQGARTAAAEAAPLSEREREVLALLADGASDKEMAARPNVSRTTVGTYVARLTTKLEAKNRTQLAAIAVRQGLLDA